MKRGKESGNSGGVQMREGEGKEVGKGV